ncbi:Transcription factor GTE7 [Forsythia ovata]|uniref:Transcription factor GTE7 n=1 Tax=Forsythia ovata TaxID=205694 RepID=A0ABD1UC99_9LAMI
MASAVLASQNEGYWGERNVYMRKYNSTTRPLTTRLNPNHNINPILTPIPNPKPNPSFRQIHEPSPRTHFRHTNEPSPRHIPPLVSSEKRPAYTYKPISVHGEYMTYNLNEFSRKEKKELKKRLFSDLDRVRSLLNRIESREHKAQPGIPFWPPTVQPNSLAVEALTQKQTLKATGKNNSKKLLGKKRGAKAPSFPYDRNSKRPFVVSNSSMNKVLSSMMKRCGQILAKLMKHKHGWVFNKPVDVKGLGLHDYHQIIKTPMDLGTVKLKLEKNVYESPLDFAADVRQTFNNAMIYNPKGQDVHIMAEILLNLFEEMFNHACKKYEAEQRKINVAAAAEQLNRPKKLPESEPLPMQRGLDQQMLIAKKSDIMQPLLNMQLPAEMQNAKSPVLVPPPVQPIATSGKLSKPKAKDPIKRDMTAEEKQKLGAVLQELPAEKLDQMIQIVKKRNLNLLQEGDEIEVDIETLDTETLWELDRFVGYHKKAVSKIQRQILFQEVTPAEQIVAKVSPKDEPVEIEGQQMKKGDVVGEEDVDIGEEIPVNNFPPVEIERDAAGSSNESSSSSSSSSGSDSSSSSDSDSESSSGSDSDEDSVQSPFVLSKENPC